MRGIPYRLNMVAPHKLVSNATILGDNLREELVDDIVQAIATQVEVTVGNYITHLAALMDPEHWEDDWKQAGLAVEDVDTMLADAVKEEE